MAHSKTRLLTCTRETSAYQEDSRSSLAIENKKNYNMCGIFGILDIKTDVTELRTQALELSKLLRHRGPDWSGIWNNNNTILCHERLAIVDGHRRSTTDQPQR